LGLIAVSSDTANIGDSYNGTSFTPAVQTYTIVQLQVEANAKANSLLGNMRSYSALGATIKSDAIASTIANLIALQQWGAANPTATTNWVANDFSVTQISGAQIVAIAPLVGAYAQSVYAALAAILGQIAGGTITTIAQVDSYGWPA
jgi:hypothetical protein